jgi:hypothetical protein
MEKSAFFENEKSAVGKLCKSLKDKFSNTITNTKL